MLESRAAEAQTCYVPRMFPHRTMPALLLLLLACGETPETPSADEVRQTLLDAGVAPLPVRDLPDPALVELGRALFFDPELSGNRDIACATCHLPVFATSDGVSLAIGTGGRGTGPNRVPGQRRRLVPRNTPDLAERGHPDWMRMGWDGAVELRSDGSISAPADFFAPMLPGLDSPLAAASLLPALDRDRMRGRVGDLDVDGNVNEIALVDEYDLDGLNAAMATRLLQHPGYVTLVEQAFPDRDASAFTFVDGANALAAFIDAAFRSGDSPLDAFLRGDDVALDAAALRGALVFAGPGRCATCHAGELLTDLRFYNLGTPQLRPGMLDEEPLDFGRGRESGRADERYAFRTPPLRNVAETGPYMHNGAYTTLEAAVRAHMDIEANVDTFDRTQLKPELQVLVLRDETTRARLRSTLSLAEMPRLRLSDGDIADLLAFLGALSDPATAAWEALAPESVPSGRNPR